MTDKEIKDLLQLIKRMRARQRVIYPVRVKESLSDSGRALYELECQVDTAVHKELQRLIVSQPVIDEE